jgi:uncharacterized protein (DUF2062 family)
MVFKRRSPRGWFSWSRQMIYPDGGFRRATRYVMHRLSRLPDDPRKVARGVFAGMVVSFLPIPGFQFLAAWGLAWIMRGNVLASLLATFASNPLTTPFIAVFSVGFGHWLLGIDAPLSAEEIGRAFAHAGDNLWKNFLAIFTAAPTDWSGVSYFWHTIWWPYFVGSIGPAILAGIASYYITIPVVEAYQRARHKRAVERAERRRRLRAQMPGGGDDAGAPPL